MNDLSINEIDDLSIVEIQEEMKQLPQTRLKLVHHFADGCYARELHMSRGNALVGALHKTNHHWILSKGKILLRNGNESEILTAPYHGITKSGDKRLMVCIEDCVMTSFHVTELKDIDEIGRAILGEELCGQ